MNGTSLGLRSGSYGSLLPPLPPNGVAAVTAASIQTASAFARKPAKMLLQNRDKERRLSWVVKAAGRRRVGMFLLLIVASAVVVFCYVSIVGKDEDVSVDVRTNLEPVIRSRRTSLRSWKLSPVHIGKSTGNTMLAHDGSSINTQNETHSPPQILPLRIFPMQHPCENFSLPPPPPSNGKRTGPRPCPVCYIPVDLARSFMPALPSKSPRLENLNYISEEKIDFDESNGGSAFGGHPSLQQRSESFDVKESMTVHCGFAKGKKPGQHIGFDISDEDLLEMEECRGVVVASAIFGNYDIMQQPKNVSDTAKREACFYMFVDEETEAYIKNSSTIDVAKRVGLWRVVVVRNLPYLDARRNGKVPKLLLHRLFPRARFSLWIDGKLELVVDPYQILERFLWRNNASFAISRHYRRFDVFEEAEANKAAGKYDNASIDYQIDFYRREGLSHYTRAKLPITSDVPEGCVIIREHIPITNLFSCLWFNEVDRFTSRDQISFSTVRDKLMSKVSWSPYMFLDCERRNFVIQAYHRDLLEQRKRAASYHLSQAVIINEPPKSAVPEPPPVRKLPLKRGKDKRTGPRRRRPKSGSIRLTNLL